MAVYLRNFDNHSDYESFTGTSEFFLPNVSYCKDNNEVHYNPSVEPVLMNVITYSASSQLNVDLTAFTPAATAHTFVDGVGKIEFSEPVTEIGYRAFYDKNALTSIEIPDSVTSIGNYAFNYCRSLTSVTLPSGITSIGSNTFSNCRSLTSVTIPSGVTSIGYNAFQECINMTSITIPDSVTSIGQQSFQSCSGLTSIDIPDSVTFIGDAAFQYCNGLTSVDIPSSVTSIDSGAFSNCSGLTSVTIPSSVTSISFNVFRNCSGLTSVTVDATTPPTLGRYTFDNTNNCPIYVPCASVAAYKAAENWSAYASRIQCVLPTTAITYTATSKLNVSLNSFTPAATAETFASGVGKIEFAEPVTEIKRYAFEDMPALKSIGIPNSVTNIRESAFFESTGLTSVTIPDSVTTIEYSLFNGCESLRNVTIPSSVTSIGSSAFWDCYALQSITVDATTPPTLGASAFYETPIESGTGTIYVPSGSVEAYKVASGWSAYTDRIQAKP